jgi:hypothetical protein
VKQGQLDRAYYYPSVLLFALAGCRHLRILLEKEVYDATFRWRHRREAEWTLLSQGTTSRSVSHALDSFDAPLPVTLGIYYDSLRERPALINTDVKQILNGINRLALLTY